MAWRRRNAKTTKVLLDMLESRPGSQSQIGPMLEVALEEKNDLLKEVRTEKETLKIEKRECSFIVCYCAGVVYGCLYQ